MREGIKEFVNMRFKRIFQIGVWAFCLLVAFSVHGSVRDKGYILVINSYTEGAIWSNYVIDSIRKDRSIGENVAVESMNTLLIDDEESMRVKKDDVLSKYTELPKAIVLLGSSAWCLFEQELNGIWKDVPMILCVENDYVAPVEAFLKKHEVIQEEKIPLLKVLGEANVTIIKCPVYIRETIEEMRLLLPDLEKIVLMSDHRYVSAQVRCQMRKVCEQYFPDLEVAYFTEGEY
ncbi:MAG: hybrid sensor histidine kinase/response regulator, partial [Butyricimonas faecihominis]